MLSRYLPHLPPKLEHFAIIFAMYNRSDVKYLSLIQEVHEVPSGQVARTANISMQPDTDWIFTLCHKVRGSRFLCRKGKQPIKATVSSVIKSISSEGLVSLLGKYYSDWPTPCPDRTFKLQTIRLRDGGSLDYNR